MNVSFGVQRLIILSTSRRGVQMRRRALNSGLDNDRLDWHHAGRSMTVWCNRHSHQFSKVKSLDCQQAKREMTICIHTRRSISV